MQSEFYLDYFGMRLQSFKEQCIKEPREKLYAMLMQELNNVYSKLLDKFKEDSFPLRPPVQEEKFWFPLKQSAAEVMVLVEDPNGSLRSYEDTYQTNLDFWRRIYGSTNIFKMDPFNVQSLNNFSNRSVNFPSLTLNSATRSEWQHSSRDQPSILPKSNESMVDISLRQQYFTSKVVALLKIYFREADLDQSLSSSGTRIVAEVTPGLNQKQPILTINEHPLLKAEMYLDVSKEDPTKKRQIVLKRDHKIFEENGIGVSCILSRNFHDNVDYGIYESERRLQY